MAGVSRNTVNRLLLDLGSACSALQGEKLVNLPSKRIQVDEIWSFVGMKEANVPEERKGELGSRDVWTWVALDADSRLAVSWLVGDRGAATATDFLVDVSRRLANRVQLTSDGHQVYLKAVADTFGVDIDYAMLVKHYGSDLEHEKRYSPAKCIGCDRTKVVGNPDPEHVSTSYVEGSNLIMRMSIRRFTRLTNAFSKKLEQHICAISLHFTHYNFCHAHGALRTERNSRVTPAMAAGVEKAPWTIEQLVGLLPAVEHKGGRPKKDRN